MLLACQADAEGCGKENIKYLQRPLWHQLLSECAKVDAKAIMAQGHEGFMIKEALHQQRVACANLILNSWKKNEK